MDSNAGVTGLTVTHTLDDDLVAGVAQDGVIEEAKPLVHSTVAPDDEVIEIRGLLGANGVEFWRA